ncbi:MAG TPA: hypothetical protein VMV49_17560 [Candidatus Deferrimicrobium sp.]|nr:hypothetical protein [Candidatus Deferrimicrobium sp.]
MNRRLKWRLALLCLLIWFCILPTATAANGSEEIILEPESYHLEYYNIQGGRQLNAQYFGSGDYFDVIVTQNVTVFIQYYLTATIPEDPSVLYKHSPAQDGGFTVTIPNGDFYILVFFGTINRTSSVTISFNWDYLNIPGFEWVYAFFILMTVGIVVYYKKNRTFF